MNEHLLIYGANGYSGRLIACYALHLPGVTREEVGA